MSKRKPKAYRVIDDTSVRASPEPSSPDYDEWVHFAKGDLVTNWPAHADVEGWVGSGHWVPVDEEGPNGEG